MTWALYLYPSLKHECYGQLARCFPAGIQALVSASFSGKKVLNEFIVQVEKCFDSVCSFCRTRHSSVIIVTVPTKWRAGEWGFDSQQDEGFVSGIWGLAQR
jgi:hypothetical protein